MEATEASSQVTLSDEEQITLRDYLVTKHTAVLTVMFTDIQGFTEATEKRGEAYSKRVREAHDRILVDAIEERGAGMVVKFIGDAVMAVFAEPSVAVERALLIQQRLDDFNRSQSELDDILVRIGLHMGQVAVEDAVQADVFGRHVNRAARIESLASGGQVFVSHAVFDSARGWLQERNDLSWHPHGEVLLKGIDEPVSLYEVCGAGKSPRAPANAVRPAGTVVPRQGRTPLIAGGVLAGLLVIVGVYIWSQATDVWLQRFYPEALVLNATTPVLLEGERTDEKRRISNAIPPGRHVLHYDTHRWIRYYAEVEVERGLNVLSPRFDESRLPRIQNSTGIGPETAADKRDLSTSKTVFYFDADGVRQERPVELGARVSSAKRADGKIVHRITWRLKDGGSSEITGTEEVIGDPTSSSTERQPTATLHEAPPLRYFRQIRARKQYVYVTVGVVFTE